jgi:4-hydroxy-tetrahydrodipicolinate reductase
VPITARREGEVPGVHTVEWRSGVDAITLTHESFNRAGLAAGAVMAAEFLRGRTGIYSMDDLLENNDNG